MGILKHLIRAFFVGVAVFVVLVLIQYANGYTFSNVRQFFYWFFYNQLYAITLYIVNAYYFYFLLKLYPNQVFKPRNLLKGALGGILLTLLSLFVLRIFTETLIEGKNLQDFFSRGQLSNYYIGFIISVVVTAIFYTVYYYQN